MGRTRLSGCARRRARSVARRENVARIVERIEDKAFYENGTIPASATSASICVCGARSFSRGDLDHDAENDWYDAHAECGVSA